MGLENTQIVKEHGHKCSTLSNKYAANGLLKNQQVIESIT